MVKKERGKWKYKMIRKKGCTQIFKKTHKVWHLIDEKKFKGTNWDKLKPLNSFNVILYK